MIYLRPHYVRSRKTPQVKPSWADYLTSELHIGFNSGYLTISPLMLALFVIVILILLAIG